MNYIAGSDRGEVLLLPEALEDYLAAENPVRFIDAFVGQLELGKASFSKAQFPETGRPPYHPGDLLRLYLYGYSNRVRSSRGLEREASRELEGESRMLVVLKSTSGAPAMAPSFFCNAERPSCPFFS